MTSLQDEITLSILCAFLVGGILYWLYAERKQRLTKSAQSTPRPANYVK